MSKRPRILRAKRQIIGDLTIVNPNAAGIDAGSEGHLVSVPEDRDSEPVQSFGTFTDDLHALADWLVGCGITTVAIEATGVYWIPLFEILEERGLNPKLIDSRSIGRRSKKTDVLDCQWIRQLHLYGLLDSAFRPSAEILPLRAFRRQQKMLVDYAADHIRHIQKALDLMNVKLHLVVSDIVGVSGLRIIRAILAGKTDPKELAQLRERSCHRSEQDFVKALIGNYRDEHLFALRQAVELFDVYQSKIEECDRKTAQALQRLEKQADATNLNKQKAKKRRKNQPHFDARSLLYEIAGVDLTAVHGLQASSILTILSETGSDMSPWRSGKDFSAWLALSPNNRITGGKLILKKGPLLRPNRAAQAFRLAAQTLEKAQCALGAFFRRVQARLGRAGAIKATAHKLALVFYSMLKHKTQYHDPGVGYFEQRYRERLIISLKKKAATLGFHLSPAHEVH
ncbi:MAG TPA: IS110 family transposase [Thermoanaerobaculia bacterium]